VRVLEADCAALLESWPAACVDAVITDPPWNLGTDYGPHDDGLDEEDYIAWLAGVLRRCARVCRGPLAFLPGRHMLSRVPELLGRAELRLVAVLVWRKPACEPVIWTRSPPPWGTPPVIVASEPAPGDPARGGHPCPKPLTLMRVLVEAAAPPGGLVLDPFAGSGTTLLAARDGGRRAVGIEIDGRYAELARRRLRS
jgi:site-specific DNA-methyltransferase (adenine-specific)